MPTLNHFKVDDNKEEKEIICNLLIKRCKKNIEWFKRPNFFKFKKLLLITTTG